MSNFDVMMICKIVASNGHVERKAFEMQNRKPEIQFSEPLERNDRLSQSINSNSTDATTFLVETVSNNAYVSEHVS
jgi:hypothetical protein